MALVVAVFRASLAVTPLAVGAMFSPFATCAGYWLIHVLLAAIIAVGGIEQGLLRRRAWIGMYLAPTGWLYGLLRGGIVIVALEGCKATLLAVLLLLEALLWPPWLWLLLALDIVVFAGLHQGLQRLFRRQVRPGFEGMLSRSVLAKLHTIGLALVISFGLLFTPSYDYRDVSLLQAIEHAATLAPVACAGLDLLARWLAAWHGAGWWLAQHALMADGVRPLAWLAWVVFLLASVAFTWGWTRLLNGALVDLAALHRLVTRLPPPPASGRAYDTAEI